MPLQPVARRRGVSRDAAVRVSPVAALLAAWAEAVRQGRLDLAVAHRRRLDALADERPTWEDVEWG
ncbi:MAG: hypothetical protein ACRDJH_15755 [Thermomicrobiales bacterium]